MSKDEKDPPAVTPEEKEPLKNGDPLTDGAVFADKDLDSSRARFISASSAGGDSEKMAEAHVDIEGKTSMEPSFVGLTKEELEKYANDPYWKRVRLVLLVLFWVAWVGMLVAAIVIIIVAPKCPPRPDLDWWQSSVIYQVYPRSYKDAKAQDGKGDLQGVHDNLKYIHDDLNASVIYLNPIFPSADKDFGYDITNYTDIHPDFGTLDDFKNLRIAMHKKGMKVILDFVPNHSSDKHPWFNKSLAREDPYTDYYVWHDGESTVPPNNWLNTQGGSAWTWSDQRRQWYYHQFGSYQPDLNLRNPKVQEELEKVLKFWLDLGVDGFRVDAAAHLFEANHTRDEPSNGKTDPNDYKNYDHIYTTYQPESYEIVTKWREILDQYTKDTDKVRAMIVESYAPGNETANFYSYGGKDGAHMPTNMNLMKLDADCNAKCAYDLINEWMEVANQHQMWSNWQLSNHDQRRIATRVGKDMVNAMYMLLFTLPGTSITYYGDEIGMHDVEISFEDTRDQRGIDAGEADYKRYSRDPARTPMQWSNEANAGFCDEGVTPWLPVAKDYTTNNLKTQRAHGSGITSIEVFPTFTLLRQEPSFQWGDLEIGVIDDVLFYIRQAQGFPGFLVAINFGPRNSTINFVGKAPKPDLVPVKATVAATTHNFDNVHRAKEFEVGRKIALDNVYLKAKEGIVFKWKVEDIPEKEL